MQIDPLLKKKRNSLTLFIYDYDHLRKIYSHWVEYGCQSADVNYGMKFLEFMLEQVEQCIGKNRLFFTSCIHYFCLDVA